MTVSPTFDASAARLEAFRSLEKAWPRMSADRSTAITVFECSRWMTGRSPVARSMTPAQPKLAMPPKTICLSPGRNRIRTIWIGCLLFSSAGATTRLCLPVVS